MNLEPNITTLQLLYKIIGHKSKLCTLSDKFIIILFENKMLKVIPLSFKVII